MSAKRQLTLHLDADVATAVETEGKRLGLTLSRTANDAMRRALLDDAGEGLANAIRARLDRLDKRDQARADDLTHVQRELILVKEALLLFVRVWLQYAGPVDESDSDAGADAEVRFQGFLDLLAEQAGQVS